MKLEQFAKMRGYQLAETYRGSRLIDSVLQSDDGDQVREQLKFKRVQFDAAPELYDELERVAGVLDCSKRQLMEMLMAEGLYRAEAIWQEAFAEASGVDIADAFPAASE